MKIQIVNGANLNLLGQRETAIYGTQSFDECLAELQQRYPHVSFAYFQSNSEGALIDCLQEAASSAAGIILNAGGYTHTSVSLHDCIRAIAPPVIEVHLSNIYARESFRHTSLLSGVCAGVIAGFGMASYRLAVEALLTGVATESNPFDTQSR